MAAPPRPHVALVGFGTAGDIHPLLALGQFLRARGHAVSLLANEVFAPLAHGSGLSFVAVGRAAEQQRTLDHPKLWHPIDGLGVMWRYMLRPTLLPTCEALAALAERGPCVALASPVAMGARLAHEKHGIPLGSLYTAATMLRTTAHPMTLAQWRVPRWYPRPLRQAAWALLDRFKLQPLVRPDLDALRAHLGLAPLAGSVFGQWMHAPQGGLALFPAWFAPAAPDWPAQVRQAGFPLYDAAAAEPPPAAVAAFVAQGPAPVVFMPGTGRRHIAAFFQAAVRACAATGQRGLLLGDVPPALAGALPPTLLAARHAPFDWLLPQARALVHHGGVGSSAQALRAGVPQLVLPSAYDQYDNAMRLEHLGVGRTLAGGAKAFPTLAAQLQQLLADDAVQRACRRHAPAATPEAARAGVAALVDDLALQVGAR